MYYYRVTPACLQHIRLNLPCILKLPLANILLPLLFRKIQEFKISPVVKRARSITGQNKEERRSCHRDNVEWKKEDKFDYLSEGEWRVLRPSRGFTKSFYWRVSIWIYDSIFGNEFFVALAQEDCIEDVDQGFVNEERFEKCSNNRSTLS